MFTRCPHCNTFFGVGAAHLRAARGRVRCGSCLSVFDGIAHLTDVPQAPRHETPENYPLFNDVDTPRPASSDDTEYLPWEDDETEEESPPTLGVANDDASDSGVPEALKEDLARSEAERRALWKTALLTLAALMLLAGLALQYAWFQPARVLAAYPQAGPWLQAFCVATGCRLPERRDPSMIRILARDVRVHPRYEGALLVSATLINAAPHAQPYPRVQFSVFNVNGQTIASRVFTPEEYLSQDLDPGGDMSPGKPLQISLELIAPEDAAVSYEFRFL